MNQEKDMDTDPKLPCGPEKDIGYYIKRINDKLKAGFDAYLRDVDLTSSQARVLEYVYWNGDTEGDRGISGCGASDSCRHRESSGKERLSELLSG